MTSVRTSIWIAITSSWMLAACGRISYEPVDGGPPAPPGPCDEYVGTDYRDLGSGTGDIPYLLCNRDQLLSWAPAMASSEVFVLGQDIDLAGTAWTPAGTFAGTLDGMGHAIRGVEVTIDGPAGLFVAIGPGGTVRNLSLLEVRIVGRSNVGGLAGSSTDAAIEATTVTGTVIGSGDNVGGVIGDSSNTTALDLRAVVSVKGEANVGGLVGLMSGGRVERSTADGVANGSTAEGCTMVGGLVGYANGATIAESFGNVTVASAGAANGGLVGWAEGGTVRDCYATGSVSGGRSIDDTCSSVFDLASLGGLIGVDYNGTVERSYATGATSTPYIIAGGLIGHSWTTSVMRSNFAIGLVTASNDRGGLYGRANGGMDTGSYWSIAGTGAPAMCGAGPTAACNNARGVNAPSGATYFFSSANPPLDTWDFTTIWQAHPDALPTLRWQGL